ncbi:MAG: hypothetical protein AAF823_09705 [Planctomycetota bacterium]
MRLDLKDDKGDSAINVRVQLDDPPTVVGPTPGTPSRVSLDWDRALDDAGNLRHCPVCGCPDLYASKAVPQVTGFVLLAGAAVMAVLLAGLGQVMIAVVVFALLVVVDVVILVSSKRRLTCYQCGTDFTGIKVPAKYPRWSATIDERYKPVRRPGVPGVVRARSVSRA